jgi:two-component system sensor histidine kinase PilS (NtrC family)
MFHQRSPAFLYDPALAAKVWWLIGGRLALTILIVVGGWWWGQSSFGARSADSISTPGVFLAVVAVLSVFYAILLQFARTLLWQIRTQYFFDTLLITWLVWETGDFISPYITLYIILISLAGFFLGKTDAIVVSAVCAVCFTALPLVTGDILTYSVTGEVVPSRTLQTIAFHDAAFLLVGLLAARIADRRKIGDELKRAESNFSNLSVLHERILGSINSGLITTDLQGKIYAFNNAAREITGINAKDAIGQSIFSVFGDEIRRPVELCLSGTQTVEFSPPNFEINVRPSRIRSQSGRPITIACTVLPLVGGSQGITGLIIAFHDTTELRSIEEKLRRSDRLAAVGRLAAGLAHEIRNPLGAMSSALQFMAAKARPDDPDAALMGVVLHESDRLNTIITDFLAYARPQSRGDSERRAEQIDVSEAIAHCLALLRHDPSVSETHEFEFEPPAEPVKVQADDAQLKQVLWNLFRNSIQAMPEGGVLSIDLLQPAGGEIRVVVTDTGCGIQKENIDRIFEPFQSGSHGTGLGLSIVHRIVTEAGGRIDVQSEPGSGTTVTVDLVK